MLPLTDLTTEITCYELSLLRISRLKKDYAIEQSLVNVG